MLCLAELRAAHPGVPHRREQRDGGGGRGHQGQQHPARHRAAGGATGMIDRQQMNFEIIYQMDSISQTYIHPVFL